MKVLVAALLVTASVAYADPAPKPETLVLPFAGMADVPKGTNPPHVMAGLFGGITVKPEPYAYDKMGAVYTEILASKVVGWSADKKAAWVAADVKLTPICIAQGCPKNPKSTTAHATMLIEEGSPWQPLMVHVADSATEKQAQDAGAPPSIERNIEAGAEDVAKLFESSIGDPKALADSVTDRKDGVLLGSRSTEKYVGGATMKATLKKWKLAFKVRDGVQAGVTAGKNVAWVAANVDATSVGAKADAKATPYRATFIYEQTKTGWKLVVAQFSAYASTI